VRGDKSSVDLRGCGVCVSFCGELALEEKNVGVGMFGMRPEGIEMDGKAFESLFRALSPADCERCCLDCV
jgi:hypothetical protein